MNTNLESGQVSKLLIILVVVILVMAGVVFAVLKLAANNRARVAEQEQEETAIEEPPKPVYEIMVGDIRFLFDSAIDLGPVIKAQTSYQQDIKTTEKFIYVTVRAQNKGQSDTGNFAWDIGNIVDSAGRNFVEDNNAYSFLPKPNRCGAVLKPEFEPTPCVKIYQVSKASDHLKVEVMATSQNSSKKQTSFLDLYVR